MYRRYACPDCQHKAARATEFCSNCGKKIGSNGWIDRGPLKEGVVVISICTQCGAEFNNGENYCPDHGKMIVDKEVVPVIYEDFNSSIAALLA